MSQPITKYSVLSGISPQHMAELVSAALPTQQPLGAPVLDRESGMYCQAMVESGHQTTTVYGVLVGSTPEHLAELVGEKLATLQPYGEPVLDREAGMYCQVMVDAYAGSGGFSAEAEQLSEEAVSIVSKAESGTDYVSYEHAASLVPYGSYTVPVSVRKMGTFETNITGTDTVQASGELLEMLGRGDYKHEVSTEITADTGGVFAAVEATEFGFNYSYTAELNYNHPVEMENGITSSWSVYLNHDGSTRAELFSAYRGGTQFEETRAAYGGGYEMRTGGYVRDEAGVAMTNTRLSLLTENDNDNTRLSVVVGAMDSDGQTDIRQAAILLENVDRLLLTGAPKGAGTDTPTLGSTAPVAGLQIVEWLTLIVDGQTRYLPLFGTTP